jgi:hypothetical protein
VDFGGLGEGGDREEEEQEQGHESRAEGLHAEEASTGAECVQ